MSPEGTPLLEVDRVSLSFGGLLALSELELQVEPGEVVSVIGPNGAGKTTLFNLITGIYRPDDGQILLDGRDLVGLPAHTITKLGVARTFQTLRLFLNMTVRENVMASQYGRTKAGVLRSVLRTPGQGVFNRTYARSYRRTATVDEASLERWKVVHVGARFAERIPSEYPRLTRYLEERAPR